MEHQFFFASHTRARAASSARITSGFAENGIMADKDLVDQLHDSNLAVVDYISQVTAQLAQIAAAQHYTTLAQVLEMAWLESEQLRSREAAPEPLPRRRAAG
jgi:hypothetical protein